MHAESLLTRLTGAEAAIVVNNNAAATMLIVAGLAAGREVLISRGELVEIGGGFRVPDVMRQSGASLREVGTTNRTRVTDYTAAVSAATAMFLRVHPSNFRIEGFTERPSLIDLVAAARAMHLPVVEDIGSGCVVDDFADEPSVQASIAAGVDLVCFSGDKLLGGPQAGIIVGKKALVDPLRKHPLMRAVRADKMAYAVLEATLARVPRRPIEVDGSRPADAARIAGRDRSAGAGACRDARQRRLAGRADQRMVSRRRRQRAGTAIADRAAGDRARRRVPDRTEAWLRSLDPPVIARIEHDRVVLDLRTVLPGQQELLAATALFRSLACHDTEPAGFTYRAGVFRIRTRNPARGRDAAP